jgi:hypothetical protein
MNVLERQLREMIDNLTGGKPFGQEPSTIATETRVPRMHGWPPKTSGSTTIRFNSSTSAMVCLHPASLGHSPPTLGQ